MTTFLLRFPKKLDNASEIILVGTHLSSILTSHYKSFEQKLKKGHSLKFLLISPNGSASKMATMRFPGTANFEQEKNRIISSIETLNELKKISPNHLQIKTIDFLFDYTAYLFEPNNSNGTIFIERHTFKTSGGAKKPKVVYEYGDDKWFEHLKSEIEIMWDNANEQKE